PLEDQVRTFPASRPRAAKPNSLSKSSNDSRSISSSSTTDRSGGSAAAFSLTRFHNKTMPHVGSHVYSTFVLLGRYQLAFEAGPVSGACMFVTSVSLSLESEGFKASVFVARAISSSSRESKNFRTGDCSIFCSLEPDRSLADLP